MSDRSDDPQWPKDGSLSFEGGVDSGRPPFQIEPNQLASAINCTVRGGRIRPRPGWFNRPLTFASPQVKAAFESGFFQEGGFYDGADMPCLLSSHSGRQFRVSLLPAMGTTATTAGLSIPLFGASVVAPVLSSFNMSLAYPDVAVDGYPFTLTAIDPDGFHVTLRNDTLSNAGVALADGSTVVFGPIHSYLVDDITPTVSTPKGSVTTASGFTIPGAGASAPLSVSDATLFSVQRPLILVGGEKRQTLTADVTAPSYALPDTLHPVSLPVSSVAAMSAARRDLGLAAATTTPGVVFPAGIGTHFTLTVASTQGMSTAWPSLSAGANPLTLLSVDSPTTLTVQNNLVANESATVAAAAPVTFYTPLILAAVDPAALSIQIRNALAANAGMAIAPVAPAAAPKISFSTGVAGGTTTTNAAPAWFVIPALNGTVAVPVASTAGMPQSLIGSVVSVGAYRLTLAGIDGPSQVTLKNPAASNATLHVAAGSAIGFTLQGSTDVLATNGFLVPAVGATAVVPVASSDNLSLSQPAVTVNGLPLTLTALAAGQITVLNNTVDNTGKFVPAGSTVSFATAQYALEVVGVVNGHTVTVENSIAAQAAKVIPTGSYVAAQIDSPNNPDNQLGWSVQAGRWWVLQDNQSLPILHDGSRTYRADPAKSQAPVGNVMCYAQGRLAVALPDRAHYRIGDLEGGPSGTPENNFQDAILYFTETLYLNEGGDYIARVYGAPTNAGVITAMVACAQTDTQLGQGPLMVHTPNVIFTVNLPFDRSVWKNMQNPLQTANTIPGATGQGSCTLSNTDVWYRSLDGVRSYIMAWRQMNSGPSNTPQSNEVAGILDADTQSLLEHGSAVEFDNRRLQTVSPALSPNGVWHRGLAVLDHNLNDGLRRKLGTAWECLWTGLRVLKIVKGMVDNTEHCWMFVLNDQSKIELWELSTRNECDGDWLGNTPPAPISWTVETRSFNCRNSDQFKRLKTARIAIPVLSGTLTSVVSYKTDERACWDSWTSFTRCARNSDCGRWTSCFPTAYLHQPRRPIRLVEPPDDFDGVSHRLKRLGREFQLRLQNCGYAEIADIRIFCLDEKETLGPDNMNES